MSIRAATHTTTFTTMRFLACRRRSAGTRGRWKKSSTSGSGSGSGCGSSFSSRSSSSSSSGGGSTNPFSRAFQWYSTKLETHPIITKGLTAGFIGALGDVSCQVFIDKPEQERLLAEKGEPIPSSEDQPLWWWQAGRTTRFFVLGVGLVGPWCHAWFGFLARTFPELTVRSIVTRVALDQFAFTPVILSAFISGVWTLESLMGDAVSASPTSDGKEQEQPADDHSSTSTSSLANIPQRLKETLPDVIVANWMLWGPVQLFNFRVVPQKYQVLFANMISLVWNAYLSFSTRAAVPVSPEVEQDIIDHAPMPVVLVQRITTRVRHDGLHRHPTKNDETASTTT
mmetsp:Transcript_13975/g.24293  ORF Transcript_13975/g.24293 Transcript_13975/m.24293 type:complete len:341 (+) Transcript_13975:156-1178(+)